MRSQGNLLSNFGNERIIGLSINIPLAGRYRDERMRQALQESRSPASRSTVNGRRSTPRWQRRTPIRSAPSNAGVWPSAAPRSRASARQMQRAYFLGEAELQALLVQRQALDTSRPALEARAEALRWSYRLLIIDTHLIWNLAHD